MTPEQEILADGLAAARQQVDTFVRDLADHADVIPFGHISDDPSPELRLHATAFVKRFEMMQDQITRKLFRSVLAVKGTRLRANNLAHVVGEMVALGVVDDAALWDRITKLRNIFAHDYMLTFDALVPLVNEAWKMCPTLIGMVSRLETYVATEGLLEETP